MKRTNDQKILANIPRDLFVGRTRELESLLNYARSGVGQPLSLLKAPGAGATELLLQVYDELFKENSNIIPVYFALRSSDTDEHQLAERYHRELLTQIIASRTGDSSVIRSEVELPELAQICAPTDREWVRNFARRTPSLRSLLATGLTFRGMNARIVVMIDDVENITRITGGQQIAVDLMEIIANSGTPCVIAGARRFLFGKVPGKTIRLERPSVSDCAKIAALMAKLGGVALSDQTRDLVAVQTSGDLRNIRYLFAAASEKAKNLDRFSDVESTYAGEIFGGRISLSIEAQIDEIVPESAKPSVMELLRNSFGDDLGHVPISDWRQACELERGPFRQMMRLLHRAEFVNCSAGGVNVDRENHVLADLVNGRCRLEEGTPRALVIGESLSRYISRAPQLLARYYRRNAGLGLRGLLTEFDGQEIAAEVLDYRKFKDRVKGLAESDAASVISDPVDRIKLPHIAFSANTSAFYPKLEDLIDGERSAIAIGFEDNNFERSVWIAAEVDSKLEADAQLAEFWCDRLEMAAAHCGFSKFTIWLTSPEGFSEEALDILDFRNAVGSSRQQVELLRQAISAVIGDKEPSTVDEYEMIIPMGNDTEMIAARTLEDIARKYEFPSKMINQMKTALVEACINAAEHSLSPDRRIYQKFRITDERAEITVANRGLRLLDRVPSEAAPANGRRGWGLKLIKSLMDEVRIEASDDGTRITMVKHLRPLRSN